jgi:hypothetical protein
MRRVALDVLAMSETKQLARPPTASVGHFHRRAEELAPCRLAGKNFPRPHPFRGERILSGDFSREGHG